MADLFAVRRPDAASGIGPIAPVPPVESTPRVRLGATRPVDLYTGGKQINPFGLQALASEGAVAGLKRSNVSAVRHRMSMGIIRNMTSQGV